MTCSTADPHLLDDALAPEVEAHLADCAACRALRADLRETQAALRDHLATPAPAALRPAFAAHLEDAKRSLAADRPSAADRPASRPMRRRAGWAVAFAAVFALGVLTARSVPSGEAPGAPPALAQLASDSPAERLAGIVAVRDEAEAVPPRALVDALLVTLHTDPSVNVRVAALDALAPFGGAERVRVGVLRALAADPEPLVQLAALRFVEAHQPADARHTLDALLAQPDLEPLVRSQAETLTLSS